MKKYTLLLLCFLSISIISAQFNYRPNQIGSTNQLTGEDYITGDDGVPRMSINVWGHVKYPGTYLVYDGIDVLTCLSMAGGPMTGAKLKEVSIVSKDGNYRTVNLDKLLRNSHTSQIKLKPYDTIYIDETLGNYLLARSNVINILLQITNLILISTNNK